MNSLNVKSEDQGWFALFKGPSGAGKTVAALSWPDPGHIDLDRKMPAVARKHFPKKSIEYYQYPDIFALGDQINEWVEKDNCPHETLITDSVTSMASLIIKSIGEKKGESTPKLLQSIQRTQAGKQIVEMLGIDYYNAETRFVEWYIDVMKFMWIRPSNPKNIIFIAHVITTESAPDLKTKVVTRTRSIVTAGRKVAAYIPTQFDEVYMFGYKEMGGLSINDPSKIHYIMSSQPAGEDDAKSAMRIARETDFTDSSLYDKLKSQISGAEMFI